MCLLLVTIPPATLRAYQIVLSSLARLGSLSSGLWRILVCPAGDWLCIFRLPMIKRYRIVLIVSREKDI